MKLVTALRLTVLTLSILLGACGGSGGGSTPVPVAAAPPPPPPPPPPPSLTGSAINSPIDGAEIKLYLFDAAGAEMELVASNAPVMTDAAGAFDFVVDTIGIAADAGPVIVRTVGGTMNSAAAPVLEAVVPDSESLRTDGVVVTRHLSIGSSVAAGLLRQKAPDLGATPTSADANAVIALVEQELGIGLDQDPADPMQPIAVFNLSVDENLAMTMTPDNSLAIDDFIDYLQLNLGTGQLDNLMRDPTGGVSSPVPASFAGVGMGLLASRVPDGPTDFRLISFELDKDAIENDGLDTAYLTATLSNAVGEPVNDGAVVLHETTVGRLVLSEDRSTTVGGQSQVNISSTWSGDTQVMVGYQVANQVIGNIPVDLTVVDNEADVVDTEKPRLVSAGATSNTEILVSFTEAMRGGMESTENPTHYRISVPAGANRTPEVRVIDAELLLPERHTVRLTTLSQSDLLYELVVTAMTDLQGNPMSPGNQFDNDPIRRQFQGIPPSGDAIIDTDDDFLSDSDEQRGWTVTVVTTSGELLVLEVTSDPTLQDTDGDGVTDNEEFHGGMNPRSADTDGDTLTDNQEWNIIYSDPTNQDTDGDGTQDGFEFYSFRTSPILADTDGDQLSDTDEVLGRNRDPRVADIPRAGINVGEVRLQIDERFSYEDAQQMTVTVQSNSSSTLSQSENTSFKSSNSALTQHVAGGKIEAGYDGGVTANIEGSYQYTSSDSFTTDRESAAASQQAHQQSLEKGLEFNTTNTVSREIVGASIDVDLTIRNEGDLAFAISNLEITVLQRDSQSTDRFVPVATLIPNSTLTTGAPAVFNLGPFTPQRGPIIFSSRDVFPNLVEELMQFPAGIIFRVANFDMTDEFGRVFTFANQVARDRNAGIIVDSGDGVAQQFLVATALQPTEDASAVNPRFPHVGGFDFDGSSLGIPLDFALQNTLGFVKNSAEKDGIVAGPNGVAESLAGGDDVQLIPAGTTGVPVGSIVVSAGQNGELNFDDGTMQIGDDVLEVTTGYETSLACSAASINPGDICNDNSDCEGGTCNSNGPEVLVRFNGFRNGDFDRTWAVFTNGEIQSAADFGKVVLKPGADLFLAFVQDLDEDGLFAREEYMVGSTDSRSDRFENASFGIIELKTDLDTGEPFYDLSPVTAGPDEIPDSKDTDRDGIGDFAEVRVGWRVSADGPLRQLFSSPRLADSDGDGLFDLQEQDLRDFCDPVGDDRLLGDYIPCWTNLICDTVAVGDDVQVIPVGSSCAFDISACITGGLNNTIDSLPNNNNDYREDGLCRWQSEDEVLPTDAVVIIAGRNRRADTTASEFDQQLVSPGASGLTYGTPIIGEGNMQGIQTELEGDDVYVSEDSLRLIPPASDPRVADTDFDGIGDFNELLGFEIGLSIRDGGNGIVETSANGDDIQRAFLGNPVEERGIVILPGQNGTIESVPNRGDDTVDDPLVISSPGICFSIFGIGGCVAGDVGAACDTDADCAVVVATVNSINCGDNRICDTIAQVDDNQVTEPGAACVPTPTNQYICVNRIDADLVTTANNGLNDDFEQDSMTVVTDLLRLDSDNDVVSDGRELSRGGDPTNPDDGADFVDSDQDGLTDSEEGILGWNVTVDGGLPERLMSNESLADTDLDGLPDFIERDIRSNPNNPDTDSDGLRDFDEFADFEDYFGLDQQFPGFSVNGSTSMQYGTSLTLSDSDGDLLPDDDELTEGYRILLAGEPSFRQIFTNPLAADTDFDGQSDSEEKNRMCGVVACPTDATDPDTDDDGRTDGQEAMADTDPLVPDIRVTVTFAELKFNAGPALYQAQWDFSVGSDTNFPGRSVTNQNDSNLETVQCGPDPIDPDDYTTSFGQYRNYDTISFINKKKRETLTPGHGITIGTRLRNVTSCASGGGVPVTGNCDCIGPFDLPPCICLNGGNTYGDLCIVDSNCNGFTYPVAENLNCDLSEYIFLTYEQLTATDPSISLNPVELVTTTGGACDATVTYFVTVD